MLPNLETSDKIVNLSASEANIINERRKVVLDSLYGIPVDVIDNLNFFELTLLPKNSRFFIPYPYKGLINPHIREEHTVNHRGVTGDLIGSPYSGKSDGAESVCRLIRNIQFYNEHYEDYLPDRYKDLIRESNSWPLEIRNFVLSFIRNKNYIDELSRSIEEDLEFLRDPDHIYPNKLFMRGVNDLFSLGVFLHRDYTSLLGSMMEKYMDKRLNNLDLEKLGEMINLLDIYEVTSDFETYLDNGFQFLDQIDFIALYYLDKYDHAKERRVLDGLSPEGRFVNLKYWPTMERAYKWWLHFMYPFLRRNYGTGLIVINGSLDRGRNQKRLEEYVSAVIKQKETLRQGTEHWYKGNTVYDLTSTFNRRA